MTAYSSKVVRFVLRREPKCLPFSTGGIAASLILILLGSLPCRSAPSQGDSVGKRLERSAHLIRANKITEAERELSGVLKVSPNDADALNLLGTIRAQQGRLKDADTLFHRALRVNDKLVGAHMNLAYVYMLEGEPENTISEFKAVLRLEPGNAEAAYKLARLLLSQGHVDECISFIEDPARSLEGANLFLLLVLGDACVKRSDLNRGDLVKAEEAYQQVLNQHGDSQDALLGLARVARLKGDAGAGVLYLARARELAGQSPDLLYRFAVAALEIGSYEEARSSLELAVKLKPDEARYFIALGAVWLKKPDLFEADRAFRRAVEIEPGNSQAQMYLGYALLKQKRFPEATVYLEKSIATDSSSAEPFYYLGLVAQEQNDDQRALQNLEKAVKLAPSYSIAHVALGATCLKLKDYPRARQELELAARLNPDEPKVHYQLALLYARLKDPARAQNEMRIIDKLKERGIAEGKENDAPSGSPRSPQ